MREIKLSPTNKPDGVMEQNEPVRVYDTSGPWGDKNFNGDYGQGLPKLRRHGSKAGKIRKKYWAERLSLLTMVTSQMSTTEKFRIIKMNYLILIVLILWF